jgi:hypothetical protein
LPPEGKIILDVDDFKRKVLYFMKRMPSGLLMASPIPVNPERKGPLLPISKMWIRVQGPAEAGLHI